MVSAYHHFATRVDEGGGSGDAGGGVRHHRSTRAKSELGITKEGQKEAELWHHNCC